MATYSPEAAVTRDAVSLAVPPVITRVVDGRTDEKPRLPSPSLATTPWPAIALSPNRRSALASAPCENVHSRRMVSRSLADVKEVGAEPVRPRLGVTGMAQPSFGHLRLGGFTSTQRTVLRGLRRVRMVAAHTTSATRSSRPMAAASVIAFGSGGQAQVSLVA